MRVLHRSLRIPIAHLLHHAGVGSAYGNWDAGRVSLVCVRGAARVHKLVLDHLLQKLFVVRAHIICFSKTVDELLAQRGGGGGLLLLSHASQWAHHWIHSGRTLRAGLNIVRTLVKLGVTRRAASIVDSSGNGR